MMQNAPASRHPTGGDNDERTFEVIDRFWLLGWFGEDHIPWPKWVAVMIAELRHFKIVLCGVARINPGRFYGHRAIEVHGNRPDLAGVFHFSNRIYQILRSADGKRRNQKTTALLGCFLDDIAQLSFRLLGMNSIPIGRFYQQPICRSRRLRVLENRPIVAAEIARIQESSLLAIQLKWQPRRARPENMADSVIFQKHALYDFDGFVHSYRAQKGQRTLGVVDSVKRQCRGVLRVTLAIRVTRFFLL